MSLFSSHIRLDQRPAFARRLASALDLTEDFDIVAPHSAVVSTYQLDSEHHSEPRQGSLCLVEVDENGNISLKKSIPKAAGVFRFEYLSSSRLISALTNGSLSIDDLNAKSDDIPVCDNMLLDVSPLDGVAFTSDNKGNAYVVDLNSETLVSSWLAHQLAYSNDPCEVWTCSLRKGNVGCTGAEDETLKIWDTRSRTLVSQCKLFEAGVTFSQWIDENQILTGSYDEHIRVLDTRNLKQEVHKIKANGGVWNIEIDLDKGSNPLYLVSCMYGGWMLMNSNFDILKQNEEAGKQLLYGATIINSNKLIYTTFNDFTVSVETF
ncbi:hypothetical protein WR25_02749 isoform B [Diploscapter pachys]|uniref:methylated diphthine methylhydrolase n=1 Tax=Diploscapter pachys TaxID=2018661 RepID=A0A2A2LRQ2_9BILA|nr:hypothetical protein WR25_02749 isoform A [Diploscapter pachys]PAV88904.1 hypothetical protein WR25_02749 isoform B [Diploscapter pachys]